MKYILCKWAFSENFLWKTPFNEMLAFWSNGRSETSSHSGRLHGNIDFNKCFKDHKMSSSLKLGLVKLHVIFYQVFIIFECITRSWLIIIAISDMNVLHTTHTASYREHCCCSTKSIAAHFNLKVDRSQLYKMANSEIYY